MNGGFVTLVIYLIFFIAILRAVSAAIIRLRSRLSGEKPGKTVFPSAGRVSNGRNKTERFPEFRFPEGGDPEEREAAVRNTARQNKKDRTVEIQSGSDHEFRVNKKSSRMIPGRAVRGKRVYNDWLAEQLREEERAKERVSSMFQLKKQHEQNCSAEKLRNDHQENCDAKSIRWISGGKER